MPDMTGDMLASELMKIRGDIPIILNTGFSESMSKEKANALGIKELLMKPVRMESLATTLRKLLDKSKGDGCHLMIRLLCRHSGKGSDLPYWHYFREFLP